MGDTSFDAIRQILDEAHAGRHVVRVRAINEAGNTIDVVGFVTEITRTGAVRIREGDAQSGHAHEFAPWCILGVERVHRG